MLYTTLLLIWFIFFKISYVSQLRSPVNLRFHRGTNKTCLAPSPPFSIHVTSWHKLIFSEKFGKIVSIYYN